MSSDVGGVEAGAARATVKKEAAARAVVARSASFIVTGGVLGLGWGIGDWGLGLGS